MYFKYANIIIPGDVIIRDCRKHIPSTLGFAITVSAKIPVLKGTGQPTSPTDIWVFTYSNYGYYIEQAQEPLVTITNVRIVRKRV